MALACLRDFSSDFESYLSARLRHCKTGTVEQHADWARRRALLSRVLGLIHHDRLMNGYQYNRQGKWPYKPRPVPEPADRAVGYSVTWGFGGVVVKRPHAAVRITGV
ncbi:hypothetical protein [Burkholderia phage BCSR129]|nr:hypothetical protein [Burkholderia phage BCSR129]